MFVKSCINFIIIVISILSIPILIYSIKNKNKNILILDIIYIAYLFIGTYILPNILGLDINLNYLFTYLSSFIYIVSIVILCKKKKKDISIKSNKVNFVMMVLIILPILLFSYSFLREYYLIKNSDLIIESNYQNGIVNSETSWYAISENFCKEITINLPTLKSNKNNIKYYTYDVDFKNDLANTYEIKSSTDSELKHIDEKMVQKILLGAKNNHSNLNKNFSKFDYVVNSAAITYFENSGYYYISLRYDYGGIAVINELIYKNNKYIGELLIHGNIKSVTYIEK